MDILLHALMALLVLGSLVALELRNLLSAVIALGVTGLGLSIFFLLLGAPDIAITQVVVEVIVVTVLIRAAAGLEDDRPAPRCDRASLACGLALLAGIAVFAGLALAALPPFGRPEPTVATWYLLEGPELTGSSSLVMSIILDFRAYDTLGEATVFLTSVVGVLVILRRDPEPAPEAAAEGEAAAEPAREAPALEGARHG